MIVQRRRVTWVFDLDNTLHDTRPQIMPHIDRSMTRYVAEHLRIDEAAADTLRAQYVRAHGATLRGLMHHHGTDPEHFLWRTHQLPDLERMLHAEDGLRLALQRLPGRRIVFSNAPLFYVEAVLAGLGLGRFFDSVYTIESVGYRAKPSMAGFRAVLRAERLDPAQAIMVEDSADNLRTAKRAGMRTVWVAREPQIPRFVDLRVRAIATLPRRLAALGFNP
jgi:putative hydrolase of the HAD superfamily